MSWAVLLTEAIVVSLTRPAHELRALAIASERRIPLRTPPVIAPRGDVLWRRATMTRLPTITGARLAIRLKCLSFSPFGIVVAPAPRRCATLIGCSLGFS